MTNTFQQATFKTNSTAMLFLLQGMHRLLEDTPDALLQEGIKFTRRKEFWNLCMSGVGIWWIVW